MLTEQGNDVYCAIQVTFLERVYVELLVGGLVVVNSQAQGGQVKSSVLL